MSRNKLSILLALALVTVCAVMAREPELRLAVPLLVGATSIMVILLAAALFFGERGCVSWSPGVILAVALLLRLLFLFNPPQLSDDLYRYLWDGSTLLHGTNPYAAAPADLRPPPGLAEIHARINHPDYVTIYPPAAQVVFAGGAALGGSVTGLKTFLLLIDMGLCWLLLALLKKLGLPLWRGVLYAWNPLPVLEIAGSGHVDGAGLALLMGAVYLLVIGRDNDSGTALRRWPFLLAGALLAGAGLVKLFPLVLAPLLLFLAPAGRRRQVIAGFIAALSAFLLPFLPQLTNMAVSLDAYARNWEFAGYAFNTLRTLTGSGGTARLILSAAFLLTAGVQTLRFARDNNIAPSPSAAAHQALTSCYTIAMALLLLTPTLQPWYALTLAAFLPFCAGPAGLVLCWVVFLTYQVQIPYFISGQWLENPQVTAVVFLAPAAAYLSSRFFRWGCKTAE